jgi:rhomboid family GlyGly-CTERM serine protease
MIATGHDSRRATRLRSLNCDGTRGLALVAALLLLAAFAAGGEPWRLALQYERHAIASGQWWRLLTAHLVHLGVRHVLLDGVGLALLWILYARSLPNRVWGGALVGSVLGIDAGLWWLAPQVQWYAGVSGVLHGGWSAGALGAWREGRMLSSASLSLLAIKLLAEQLHQGGVAGSGLPVVVDAHLYGALGGLVGALVSGLLARRL